MHPVKSICGLPDNQKCTRRSNNFAGIVGLVCDKGNHVNLTSRVTSSSKWFKISTRKSEPVKMWHHFKKIWFCELVPQETTLGVEAPQLLEINLVPAMSIIHYPTRDVMPIYICKLLIFWRSTHQSIEFRTGNFDLCYFTN